MELLRVFMRSDLLIIAGGGLVNDYWPTLIPRYLVITGMARALGCRVAWIGVGVGPLQHPGSRWLACRLVAISSTFAVRDSGSAALIRKSSKSSRITELTDPAWFNEPPEPSVAPSGMGIIIREPAPGDDDRASSVYDALAALISRRLASGQRTVLLTMQPDADAGAVEAIRDRLPAHVRWHRSVAVPVEPIEAMRLMAEFESLVSMRLHGLVLGSLADRPCVPIVYDAKVAAAADQLGLSAIALPMDGIAVEPIEAAMRAATSPTCRAIVRSRVSELRAKGPEIIRLLEEIL